MTAPLKASLHPVRRFAFALVLTLPWACGGTVLTSSGSSEAGADGQGRETGVNPGQDEGGGGPVVETGAGEEPDATSPDENDAGCNYGFSCPCGCPGRGGVAELCICNTASCEAALVSCKTNADCAPGQYCTYLADGDNLYCSQGCQDDESACPSGMRCQTFAP